MELEAALKVAVRWSVDSDNRHYNAVVIKVGSQYQVTSKERIWDESLIVAKVENGDVFIDDSVTEGGV